MDHLRQRSCGAVLPHCRTALHDPCRRRGKGRVRWSPFSLACAGEIGFEIVRQMYAQGFDPAFTSVAKIDYALGIPLTHLEITDPVLPIYVNAYLQPQPSMERCYAFGQALARIISAIGVTTVVLASGGMSHYPGTERYASPDLAWDREALARIAAGNLKSLVGYDAAELDAAGNVELRCWACAAAKFDIAGSVEFCRVIPDQRFEIASGNPCERLAVPGKVGRGVAFSPRVMRHAAARQHHCRHPYRADDARQGLTKGVAALHRRLRRQVGVDIDRQNRVGDLEMGQRDTERVIDLGDASEGRIETLGVHLAHDLEPDLAGTRQ